MSGGINIKNVYSCFKYKNNTNTSILYQRNNWKKDLGYINKNLEEIYRNDGAIWLNSKGNLCYRFSYYDDKILTSSAKKISLVFNNLYNINIEIRETFKKTFPKKPFGIDAYNNQILTNQLLLVKDECFNPLEAFEFL